ncbi:MAG: hypothetical protein ACRESZ_02535 [Methylococcales bacterium]
MNRFILDRSNTEFYTSHSGLAPIGLCLNCFTTFMQSPRRRFPFGAVHTIRLPRIGSTAPNTGNEWSKPVRT